MVKHTRCLMSNMQKMASSTEVSEALSKPVTAASYEMAVTRLNSLQSNVANRKKAAAERGVKFGEYNLVETTDCLKRLGISIPQLDSLNIIHVTGTKGKGSTCSFVESMLRGYANKTGFYSSPHLVHVTERIRLNGKPISSEAFASYFWTVYNCLLETDPMHMPPYFTFLTVMMFYVFLQEKVNLAVIEVGIGGQGDSTNVIQNPVVCGVTTLDYDHQSILGNTLQEIAWQKGGIFKPGSVAVTTEQEEECLAVFADRAKEKNCELFVAPCTSTYQNGHIFNSIVARQYQSNISLAVQLAELWRCRMAERSYVPRVSGANLAGIPILSPPSLSSEMCAGLKQARWPGRYQVVKLPSLTLYLDGAHTPKSMACCASWFSDSVSKASKPDAVRILLFNCTADRNPSVLLELLRGCNFSYSVFCPNLLSAHTNPTSDSANLRIPEDQQVERSRQAADVWKTMSSSTCTTEVLPCISSAWNYIEKFAERSAPDTVQILVTGSLHLVGGVMELLNVQID